MPRHHPGRQPGPLWVSYLHRWTLILLDRLGHELKDELLTDRGLINNLIVYCFQLVGRRVAAVNLVWWDGVRPSSHTISTMIHLRYEVDCCYVSRIVCRFSREKSFNNTPVTWNSILWRHEFLCWLCLVQQADRTATSYLSCTSLMRTFRNKRWLFLGILQNLNDYRDDVDNDDDEPTNKGRTLRPESRRTSCIPISHQ